MDIEITINGKKIITKTGLTILEAASQAGIRIPTLCYLRRLRPFGSCRICVVEVKGLGRPVPSCVARVKEGYEIMTNTDKVWQARKYVLSNLLLDHAMDCPVCDKSGECLLQDLTFEFGLTIQKNTKGFPDRTKIFRSDLIEYTDTRCIMCCRCIRICMDMYGNPFYEVKDKGYNSHIGLRHEDKVQDGVIFKEGAFLEQKEEKKYLDCYYCGNCIEVCPVGALISKPSKFKERYWQESPFSSVCDKCSAACKIEYYRYEKNESLVRAAALYGGYLCKKGFFYDAIDRTPDGYIGFPLVKKGSRFNELPYNEALDRFAFRLKNIFDGNEYKKIAVLCSSSVSTGNGFIISNFVKDVIKPAGFDIAQPQFYRQNFDRFKEVFKTEENFDIRTIRNSELIFYIGDIENEIPFASYNIMKNHREHGGKLFLLKLAKDNRSRNFTRFEDIAYVKTDIEADGVYQYLNNMRLNITASPLLQYNTVSFVLGDIFMSSAYRDKELLILKEIVEFLRGEQKVIYIYLLIKPFNYRGLIAGGVYPFEGWLSYEEIIKGIAKNDIKNLIYIGDYEEDENSGISLLRSVADLDFLGVLSSKVNQLTTMADAVIPVYDFLEERDAFYENFEGKLMHINNEFNFGAYRYDIATVLSDLSERLNTPFDIKGKYGEFIQKLKSMNVAYYNKIKPRSRFYYNEPAKILSLY